MNGGDINSIARVAYGAGYVVPFWFDVGAARPSPSVAEGLEDEVFYQDRVYRHIENQVVDPHFLTEIFISGKSSDLEVVSRSSSNESVCIPDPSDFTKWLYVGDGSATCTTSSVSRTVSFEVTLAQYSEDAFEEFAEYEAGSLAQHITQTVDSRITFGGSKSIYSVMDHAGSNYTRNPDCWVFDLAGAVAPFSVWNSGAGQRKAGVLITPQDIVFTVHYQLNVGDTVRFIGTDGAVYDRTITEKRIHPDYVPYSPDTAMAHLDSPLPANVPFAKLMPDNWNDYLPTQGFYNMNRRNYPGNWPFGLPAFAGDQEKKATLNEFVGDVYEGFGTLYQEPVDDLTRASYYEPKISGDSNSPGGLIVNGQLVLTEVWTMGGTGTGQKLNLIKDDLDAMLLDMGSAYTMTDADFSAFTTYS